MLAADNIRKKLGKRGLLIETVPKYGYRFKAAHA